MLQQRKKDYLLRLIDEFFKRLQLLMDKNMNADNTEKLSIMNDCHTFFSDTFGVSKTDESPILIEKINDSDLLEQYAKLLFGEYEITKEHNDRLTTALEIIEYLQNTDNTYSWERTILHEDILRKLDESKK